MHTHFFLLIQKSCCIIIFGICSVLLLDFFKDFSYKYSGFLHVFSLPSFFSQSIFFSNIDLFPCFFLSFLKFSLRYCLCMLIVINLLFFLGLYKSFVPYITISSSKHSKRKIKQNNKNSWPLCYISLYPLLFYLVLSQIIRSRVNNDYYLHLINKVTQAQKDCMTCLIPHSSFWQRQD